MVVKIDGRCFCSILRHGGWFAVILGVIIDGEHPINLDSAFFECGDFRKEDNCRKQRGRLILPGPLILYNYYIEHFCMLENMVPTFVS